jgi:hypothetical protein
LREANAVVLEHRHQTLRVDLEEVGRTLRPGAQIDRHLFVRQPLEVQRDPHPIGG